MPGTQKVTTLFIKNIPGTQEINVAVVLKKKKKQDAENLFCKN